MKSAAVIIPTTGRESLLRAYDSVAAQTGSGIYLEPIVVRDGRYAWKTGDPDCPDEVLCGPAFRELSADYFLRYNTGANYFNGHRIYGALPFLLPHDYIFYLDDDNEFHPDHVASCVDLCESKGLSWCYSFREIYDGDEFICRDECESLGRWPVWYDRVSKHIDTNCFCLKREIAVEIAPIWHRPAKVNGHPVVPPDTLVANTLMRRFPSFDHTGKFTVKYRLGSQDITPKPDFFLKGNETYRAMYPEGLPWSS